MNDISPKETRLSRLRKRPAQRFIAFFVKPLPGFSPTSWQDVPKNYRVIDYVGPKQFRGRADAWRFMKNKSVLDDAKNANGPTDKKIIERWAVVIE